MDGAPSAEGGSASGGKKVDESWKDSVRKEKEAGPEGHPATLPEADFLSFVSTLAMQVLVSLGEVTHPATDQKQTNLPQAQYLIDTIQMLSEKTRGNLSSDETNELNTLLYELRVKFVRKNQEARA